MKWIYNIALLALLGSLFFLTACDNYFSKEIDLRLQASDPTLNVIGFLELGTDTLAVWVGYTTVMGDGEILDSTEHYLPWIEQSPENSFLYKEWIADAEVKLYVDSQLYGEFQADTEDRLYRYIASGGFQPAAGAEVVLKVSHPDYPEVLATQVVPEDLSFLSADFREDEGGSVSEGLETMYDLTDLYFNDPSASTDYYACYLYRKDTSLYRGFPTALSIEETENTVLENIRQGGVFKDYTFDGNSNVQVQLKANIRANEDSQTRLYLRFYKIAKDHYLYLKSFYNYHNSGLGVLFEAPVILYTNIEGGKGIFSLYHYHEELLATWN